MLCLQCAQKGKSDHAEKREEPYIICNMLQTRAKKHQLLMGSKPPELEMRLLQVRIEKCPHCGELVYASSSITPILEPAVTTSCDLIWMDQPHESTDKKA